MLKTHSTKATVVGESSNASVWRQSSQPPETNGGSRAEPLTQRRFYSFYKNTDF